MSSLNPYNIPSGNIRTEPMFFIFKDETTGQSLVYPLKTVHFSKEYGTGSHDCLTLETSANGLILL